MEDLDLDKIRTMVPFNEMGEDQVKEMLSEASITKFPSGKMIFKRDQTDEFVYWLINGSLDLLDEKFEAKPRDASEDVARYPLDNHVPHHVTAVTTGDVDLLKLSKEVFERLAPGDIQDYALDEDDEEGVDWMSTLLSSPLFEFVPPTNIQTLFSKFEEVRFQKGDSVIQQGDPGDFFYVIQKGRAKVERSAGDKTVILAELKAGENFGQDALVSDVPRNATVTMLSNGTLMRLSEPDFESLLMQPVIEKVSLEEAQAAVASGDPKTYILDVRNPKELENNKIDGALNVPLLLLRKNLPKLKPEAVYVTACDGGKRANLAAYILNENGFTAYVLEQEGGEPETETAESTGQGEDNAEASSGE